MERFVFSFSLLKIEKRYIVIFRIVSILVRKIGVGLHIRAFATEFFNQFGLTLGL